MSTAQNSLKKSPLNFDQHPPPLITCVGTVLIACGSSVLLVFTKSTRFQPRAKSCSRNLNLFDAIFSVPKKPRSQVRLIDRFSIHVHLSAKVFQFPGWTHAWTEWIYTGYGS